MARDPGQIVFPANIERNIAAPLDSTMVVSGVDNLTAYDTFRAINDGRDYSYIGMITVVINDTEENNGLYILKEFPTTKISSWKKIGEGEGVDINEINKQIQIINNTIESQNSIISALDSSVDTISETVSTVETKIENVAPTTHTTTISGTGEWIECYIDEKPYLELDKDAIVVYHIAFFINSVENTDCFLVKTLDFSTNTVGHEPTVSYAYVTDEDAHNADQINAHIDIEQMVGDPYKLIIKIKMNITCDVFVQVNKSIKFQK